METLPMHLYPFNPEVQGVARLIALYAERIECLSTSVLLRGQIAVLPSDIHLVWSTDRQW